MAQYFQFPVHMEHSNGRVRNTIKHVCLDRCIMNHILKNNLLTDHQWIFKAPRPHKISRQATITTQSIGIFFRCLLQIDQFCPTHLWMIWHFKTIGHVACEADIKDGSLDSSIIHNIHNMGHKRSSLPGKGASWFKYHFQMGITLVETFHYTFQQLYIVTFASHQMASSEIDPFYLREPRREFFFYMP